MFFIMPENYHNKMVSVVIPVHNGGKFIVETIRSVLNQNYPAIEIIVINDGSSDNTSELVESLMSGFPEIKMIHQEKSGVSIARNNGLTVSKGEFIAFLDADDVWLPDFLRSRVSFLNAHEVAFAVTAGYEIINEKSERTGIKKVGNYKVSLSDILQWKANYITIPSGILFRKEYIKKSGGFNESLSNNADQEIIMRILAAGNDFYTLPECNWLYRRHSSNMSSNISLLKKDTFLVYQLAKKNNYFKSIFLQKKCFSKMSAIIAFSWIKDGRNYEKGLKWMLRSFFYSPVFFTGEILNRLFQNSNAKTNL